MAAGKILQFLHRGHPGSSGPSTQTDRQTVPLAGSVPPMRTRLHVQPTCSKSAEDKRAQGVVSFAELRPGLVEGSETAQSDPVTFGINRAVTISHSLAPKGYIPIRTVSENSLAFAVFGCLNPWALTIQAQNSP